MFSIKFVPEARIYSTSEPVDVFLAAASCDIWLEQPCGSKTVCGKCRVRVHQGAPEPTAPERRLLTDAELAEGWRLGCQAVLDRDAIVEVPPVTRAVAAKSFGPPGLYGDGDFDPNIREQILDVPPPDEANQFAELDLLARAAGRKSFHAELPLLRQASGILRESRYRVRAVWAEDLIERPRARAQGPDLPPEDGEAELLELGAADDRAGAAPPYGVAIDIGSTTLAAALVDLKTGAVVATLSRLNPQVKYGGDVISRIAFAQEHANGNESLHRAVIGAVSEMIAELAAQAAVAVERIFALTVAGNPTMLHAAAGVDVTPLGHSPYVGVWTREQTLRACQLGVPAHPRALARFLPMIRSHVGADTVAAALAAGLDRSDGWRLMIDLGTNSEVVLGCARRMVATSTAAGPAFEGANIHHGMRAASGAIDAIRVTPDGRIIVKTVANETPRGICGSGLIDAAAELVRAGLIAPSGYMRGAHELGAVPGRLAERMISLTDGQRAIRLAGDVVLTAQDVRQLQLIKGSIRAGVDILMKHFGVNEADIEEIDVAGAFGNFVKKTSALAIGLVPNIDPERVKFAGNAAGAGARMVLVDRGARRRARDIAERCEYVELAVHPDYQDAFCEAIPFPNPE